MANLAQIEEQSRKADMATNGSSFIINKNPYDFSGQKMACEVNLLMNDGKVIHYRRKKARKVPVNGEITLPSGSLIEMDEKKLLGMFLCVFIVWGVWGLGISNVAYGVATLNIEIPVGPVQIIFSLIIVVF